LRNHPLLQKYVIANKTGLELCPVSNQMLRYVDDFRMHPGAYYIEKGMLATLSSDDPSVYGYDSAAPTFDFFIAYATWDLTLPSLKQLALNSLTVSALDEATKQAKTQIFEAQWQKWLGENI
jgi:adenosine deaminase CECR1